MKHAWTHLPSLIAMVVTLPAAPRGQEKPAAAVSPTADPVRVVLKQKGYVAVPLTQEQETEGCFTVACKSGSETWRMTLDTGASHSSLNQGLVKRLGLKLEGEVTTVDIGGVQKRAQVFLRGLSIGDFDARAMVHAFPFEASDSVALNALQDARKLPRVDGLLGHQSLDFSGAVIDYPTRTLYLRTPLDGIWPEVEGKWVATTGQEDGRERSIDPKAAPRLEFKDRRFHLTDGGKRHSYGLHVKPREDGSYKLGFFDPSQELDKELDFRAVGLLKVAGDKLTVCLCLDFAKAKGYPDDFQAPAGSGHLLLEFRREKPRADRPADPLRTVLEKQGYVAVPLVPEEVGHFTVACKSGAETFWSVVDSGAEVLTLDLGLSAKLGLTPTKRLTAVGTSGSRDAFEVSLRGISVGSFDTRATVKSFPAASVDLSAMNAVLARHRKHRLIGGVLGHHFLRHYAAVIDYPGRTLYLRSPLDGLWPAVEGKWVAVRGQEDGRERTIDPKAPPRLEFKDNGFHLTDGPNQYVFGMHVQPGADRYTLALFDPEKEFATELPYRAAGLLKVSGDKLTVCLALDSAKAQGKMPDDFKAPADSGHVLLEFRREK